MEENKPPVGSLETHIYHKQYDDLDMISCNICSKFLKVGNHFSFLCKKCNTEGFVCSKCMGEHLIKIKMCYGGHEYYALEGEKITSFQHAEIRVMLDHGDIKEQRPGVFVYKKNDEKL